MPSLTDFASRHGIYLGRRLGRIHVAVYQWTGGKLGGHVPGRSRIAIVLVDHKGARSGVDRTTPLIYVRDGDAVAVVASKAGAPTHPAWFHNLKANPDTAIQIGSEKRNVRARVATDEERSRLWPKFTDVFPGYDMYQRNAKGRTIPIVILDPR